MEKSAFLSYLPSTFSYTCHEPSVLSSVGSDKYCEVIHLCASTAFLSDRGAWGWISFSKGWKGFKDESIVTSAYLALGGGGQPRTGSVGKMGDNPQITSESSTFLFCLAGLVLPALSFFPTLSRDSFTEPHSSSTLLHPLQTHCDPLAIPS